MKNGTILEISTHKAVKQGDWIVIFTKGCAVDGDIFTEEDRERHPDWFADEEIDRIPLDEIDDLHSIFEMLEETNRCNFAEYTAAFEEIQSEAAQYRKNVNFI